MFTELIIAVALNTPSVALDKHVDPSVIKKIKTDLVK